jgi:hypothetical protein
MYVISHCDIPDTYLETVYTRQFGMMCEFLCVDILSRQVWNG